MCGFVGRLTARRFFFIGGLSGLSGLPWVNSVEFGLSSSVYTKDLSRAFEYINTVETGIGHGRPWAHSKRADLGRRSTPVRRVEGVGGGPAGAGHRGVRLLHRDHHCLHRPRPSPAPAGAVYLGVGPGRINPAYKGWRWAKPRSVSCQYSTWSSPVIQHR